MHSLKLPTANFLLPPKKVNRTVGVSCLRGANHTCVGRKSMVVFAGQGFGGSDGQPSPQPVQVKSKSQKAIKVREAFQEPLLAVAANWAK